MLGPLPTLYRILVGAVALLVFVGGGIWTALVLPRPFLVSAGASVGLAIGALVAYWLLHSPASLAETERVRRRRFD